MSPEVVDSARDIFVALLVVCVMLSVGFEMQVHQIRAAFKRPGRLLAGLTYEHAIVPLIALGIATAVGAPPAGKLAVILCACTPGGPVGPAFVRKGNGDLPFAVAMVVLMAALNVVMTPLTLTIFGYADAVEGGIARPLIQMIALYQLLPLGIAMFVRSRRRELADRLAKVSAILTNSIIGLLIVGLTVARWEMLLSINSRTLAAIVFTIAAAMAGAFVVGRDGATRRALSLTSGVRNLSLGLLVASAAFGDEALLAVMVYGLVMLLAVAPASVLYARLSKRAE